MPYRRTSRTEARRAATRERIVAAALEQVGEGGYASATMQVVAGRARVAVGTVYRHFPSKADLFADVFRLASQRELDVVVSILSDSRRSAAERVASGVEAFARRALAGPVLAYALLAEPVDPAVESERLRLRRGYRDAFSRALEEGIESGELRAHDTQTVAAVLVGGLGEALAGPLASRQRAAASEALIVTLVDLCLQALPRDTNQERTAA